MKVSAYTHQGSDIVRGYTFECPGCGMSHAVQTNDPGGYNWGFNGNVDAPTFSPSLLVRGTQTLTDEEVERLLRTEKIEPKPLVCHSLIREGRIEFLSDCTHALAGKTVDMAEVDK